MMSLTQELAVAIKHMLGQIQRAHLILMILSSPVLVILHPDINLEQPSSPASNPMTHTLAPLHRKLGVTPITPHNLELGVAALTCLVLAEVAVLAMEEELVLFMEEAPTQATEEVPPLVMEEKPALVLGALLLFPALFAQMNILSL